MVLVSLELSITGQFRTRVVTVSADRLLALSLEIAALGGVGLARVRPNGSLGDGHWLRHLCFICLLGVRLPVLSCVSELS